MISSQSFTHWTTVSDKNLFKEPFHMANVEFIRCDATVVFILKPHSLDSQNSNNLLKKTGWTLFDNYDEEWKEELESHFNVADCQSIKLFKWHSFKTDS